MGMLLSDVTQLKSSYATLQLGTAKADGRLTLTEHLLHFESLNKQLNLGSYTIKLNSIRSVERCSGKAAGIIPVTRSGIKITTKQNHNIEFILPDPEQWLNSLTVGY